MITNPYCYYYYCYCFAFSSCQSSPEEKTTRYYDNLHDSHSHNHYYYYYQQGQGRRQSRTLLKYNKNIKRNRLAHSHIYTHRHTTYEQDPKQNRRQIEWSTTSSAHYKSLCARLFCVCACVPFRSLSKRACVCVSLFVCPCVCLDFNSWLAEEELPLPSSDTHLVSVPLPAQQWPSPCLPQQLPILT